MRSLLNSKIQHGVVSGLKSYNAGWTTLFNIQFSQKFDSIPDISITSGCAANMGDICISSVSKTGFNIDFWFQSSGSYTFKYYWIATDI